MTRKAMGRPGKASRLAALAAMIAGLALAASPGNGQGARVEPASFRGDRALGEYLAAECVTCHQKSGRVVGGVPAIVGWPEDQFVAVMHSYRLGDRDNAVMRNVAGRFGDEELLALAAYFGSLKPQK